MSKTFLAVVASLGVLVATSGGAKATFAVSVIIDGNTQILTPTSTGSINGASYLLNQTFLTTNVAGQGINVTISSTATQTASVSRLNTANISVFNGGPSTRSVVVTVEQDAFAFAPFGKFMSPTIVNSLNPGGTSTVTSVAESVGGYTNNPAAIGFTQTFTNAGIESVSGTNPSSFIQTLAIANLATNSFVNVADDSSFTLITPLPATGLMAAVGLPLLGLAGAFRRRVLG